MRTLLKLFLLMIVNAKNAKDAKGALRKAYLKEKKKAHRIGLPVPEPPVPLTDKSLDPIIPLLSFPRATGILSDTKPDGHLPF